MTSYIESNLNPDEQIIAYESLSFAERCIAIGFWLMVALMSATISKNLFVIGIMVTCYVFLWCVIAAIGFENAVTNQRVIVKRGILARDVKELPLKRIETVEYTQTILGRIFDYGTVIVTGTGDSRMIIGIIENPAQFRRAIAQQIS